MEFLPQEVIVRVFSFFLSDKLEHEDGEDKVIDAETHFANIRRRVDGTSLRALCLACKKFNDMINSPALWKIKTPRNDRVLATSFMVSEMKEDSNKLEQSLVGFRKSKSLVSPDGFSDTVLIVQERCSGDSWILILTNEDRRMSPRHVRDHYDLIRRIACTSREPEDKLPNAFRGRKIWCHRNKFDPNNAKNLEDFVQSIFEQVPPTVSETFDLKGMLEHDAWVTNNSLRRHTVEELWPNLDDWKQLMDWFVEMGQVFGQNDQVVYQAASFLDCFTQAYEVRLSGFSVSFQSFSSFSQ